MNALNKMSVPREKIPWFPAIDAGRCTGCLACLDFCPRGVYAGGPEKRIIRVERPYECVVGCSNCRGVCPAGAISFPDLEEITVLIRTLRKNKDC